MLAETFPQVANWPTAVLGVAIVGALAFVFVRLMGD